jgi:hypothetical protein
MLLIALVSALCFYVCLRTVSCMLSVSLYSPFLITPSVFFNVYFLLSKYRGRLPDIDTTTKHSFTLNLRKKVTNALISETTELMKPIFGKPCTV